MHNYAQLCKIMHDYAGCIATKTHRDCKQEGTWDCNPPQTENTVKSAAAIYAYFGQKITLLSLIFRRWKNYIVRQNIFSSGSMCRCILLDKIVHDKHNNKLHWTRVEQTIIHNYAQLCTIMQFGPIVNYAKLCTIMHVHNFPPLGCPTRTPRLSPLARWTPSRLCRFRSRSHGTCGNLALKRAKKPPNGDFWALLPRLELLTLAQTASPPLQQSQ